MGNKRFSEGRKERLRSLFDANNLVVDGESEKDQRVIIEHFIEV